MARALIGNLDATLRKVGTEDPAPLINLLSQLCECPISVDILRDTKAGLLVNKLRRNKQNHPLLRKKASSLLLHWKQAVLPNPASDKENDNCEMAPKKERAPKRTRAQPKKTRTPKKPAKRSRSPDASDEYQPEDAAPSSSGADSVGCASDSDVATKSKSSKPQQRRKRAKQVVPADDAGSGERDDERKKCAAKIARMPVGFFGACDGDVLVGIRPRTQNTIISVHNTTDVNKCAVPPCQSDLDWVRSFPDLWRTLLRRARSLPLFQGMSEEEVEAWLTEHQDPKPRAFVGHHPGTQLRLVQPGKFSQVLSVEDVQALMTSRDPLDADYIVSKFPVKPGSTTKTPTMALFKSCWRVSCDQTRVDSFDGPTVDVGRGDFFPDGVKANAETCVVVHDGFADRASKKGRNWVMSGKQQLALLLPRASMPWSHEAMREVVEQEWPALLTDWDACQVPLKGLTPAALKSAMQKTIRFGAVNVTLLCGTSVGARAFLVAACTTLCLHVGSFVPDISRFVSGLESFTKRLGVIMCEDVLAPSKALLSLLGGAVMAQRARSWKPSRGLLTAWLRTALKAYDCDKCYDWKNDYACQPFLLQQLARKKRRAHKHLGVASALLDNLRSFASDLALLRDLAVRGSSIPLLSLKRRPESMPIEHIVDQHWATGVAWCFEPRLVNDVLKAKGSSSSRGKTTGNGTTQSFAPLFGRLFKEVTGQNPRRHDGAVVLEKVPFVAACRRAQRRLLLSRVSQKHRTPRSTLCQSENVEEGVREDAESSAAEDEQEGGVAGEVGGVYNLFASLDESWAAGMVGAIEVNNTSPKMLVTLAVHDISQLVGIRRPTVRRRAAKRKKGSDSDEDEEKVRQDNSVSAEVEEKAKEKARQLLAAGVPMDKCPAPLASLHGMCLVLEDDTYYVRSKGGTLVPWDVARKVRLALDVHPGLPSPKSLVKDDKADEGAAGSNVEQALTHTGKGVEEGADDKWEALLRLTPLPVLRRAQYYLDTKASVLRLNKIGRDGTGQEQAVTAADVGTFHLLCTLCVLYPAALCCSAVGVFKVGNGPLLWKVAGGITARLAKAREGKAGGDDEAENSQSDRWGYGDLYDRRARKAWPHQLEACESLLQNHDTGKRGSFLYATVGTGKTMIIMMALKARKHQLPPYIIYTLPKSAVASVAEEIMAFGFKVRWLLPIKNTTDYVVPDGVLSTTGTGGGAGGTVLKRGEVTLILHDHLRRCPALNTLADQSLLIVDEAHKALNNSQRTTCALQLAALAREYIALTGTPVIDNNTMKLARWLSPVVPFTVTDKNFFVAATTMISHQIATGIRTDCKDVEVAFNKQEQQRYDSLVPPALGGLNARPHASDLRDAVTLSYKAADRGLVAQTLKYLDRGVMLVATGATHQERLRDMLMKAGVSGKDIFLFSKGQTLFLTNESVQGGGGKGRKGKRVPDYKVVIVPFRMAAGYTLTRLGVQVSAVFFSNQAVRTQLRGRINRIGQTRKTILYRTVHAGLLGSTLRRYQQAKSLEEALAAMGKEVDMTT